MAAQCRLPIVQQDLPAGHTYEEVCKALLSLQHASSHVFQQLQARIDAQAEHARALASRLHEAESRLEQLADAEGPPVFVTPARYPATAQRYANTFSAAAAADGAPSANSGRRIDSPGGGDASPGADGRTDDAAAAAGVVAGVSAELAGAVASLRRLASEMEAARAAAAGLAPLQGGADGGGGPRVPGRDTVELFHFFNQAPPLGPQLQQEVLARDVPPDGVASASALLMFNSTDSPFTSRVEVDLPAMPSFSQAPAFDMQSITSTLPEAVPRELRSGGASPSLSTAGSGGLGGGAGAAAGPPGRGVIPRRPLPEINLPPDLPDLAHLGSSSVFSSRRSAGLRSERWSRPPSSLQGRGGGGRLEPLQSSQSAMGAGPDAGAQATLQRRSSAAASPLGGARPQCTQPAGQASRRRQPAAAQPADPPAATAAAPPGPGAQALAGSVPNPRPPPPVPPLRLGRLGSGGLGGGGGRAASAGAAVGVQSGGGSCGSGASNALASGDGGGRGSHQVYTAIAGAGSSRPARSESQAASRQPPPAQRPSTTGSPAVTRHPAATAHPAALQLKPPDCLAEHVRDSSPAAAAAHPAAAAAAPDAAQQQGSGAASPTDDGSTPFVSPDAVESGPLGAHASAPWETQLPAADMPASDVPAPDAAPRPSPFQQAEPPPPPVITPPEAEPAAAETSQRRQPQQRPQPPPAFSQRLRHDQQAEQQRPPQQQILPPQQQRPQTQQQRQPLRRRSVTMDPALGHDSGRNDEVSAISAPAAAAPAAAVSTPPAGAASASRETAASQDTAAASNDAPADGRAALPAAAHTATGPHPPPRAGAAQLEPAPQSKPQPSASGADMGLRPPSASLAIPGADPETISWPAPGSLATGPGPAGATGPPTSTGQAAGGSSGGSKSQQALDLQRSISARHLSLGSRPSQDSLHGIEGGSPEQRQQDADAEVLGLRAFLRQRESAKRPWQ